MPKLSSAAALLLLVLLGAACGGSSGNAQPAAAPTTPGAPSSLVLASLPALPAADMFVPQRAASQAVGFQFGTDAQASTNSGSSGTDLILSAPSKAAAYALYHFHGVPGEALKGVQFAGTALTSGAKVWLGIGDYVAGRWHFFAAQTTPTGTLALSQAAGRYTSAGGDIYVVVVVFDGAEFTIQNIGLDYSDRWSVSGMVLDSFGLPIPDVVVSTPFGNAKTVTDANGIYTLGGLANGTWPVLCTKDSWTFYANPGFVVINNADAAAPVDFAGNQNGSNFLPHDPNATRDDNDQTPTQVSLEAGPVEGTVSIVDDPQDYLQFTVNTPGLYYLKYENDDADINFPLISIQGSQVSSGNVYVGECRVPFTVFTPGTAFKARVNAGGGGGKYRLSLGTGPVVRLAGQILDGTGLIPGANYFVTVTNDSSGKSTQYLTDFNGNYQDFFMEPAIHTVVPSEPAYSYVPASLQPDLTAGPAIANNFVATPVATDTTRFEPNGTQAEADANAVLPLPYDSQAVADTLVLDSPTETSDYYRVAPAAGQGMTVTLRCLPQGGTYPQLSLFLYDDDFSAGAGLAYPTSAGYETRLNAPADGGNYYIRVFNSNGTLYRAPYQLTVTTYTPRLVGATVLLAGAPVPNALVTYRDSTYGWRITSPTVANGDAATFLAAPGETITAELQRYGFDNDRQTQQATISGGTVHFSFNANPALSQDALEPNNDPAGVPVGALPFNVSATISSQTDFQDVYRLQLVGGQPLQVTVTAPGVGGALNLQLTDDMGNSLPLFSSSQPGQVSLAADVSSIPGGVCRLTVMAATTDTPYTLTAAQFAAFHIKGTVTAGGNGVTALVHCQETGASTNSFGAGGAYDLGLFPPGTYTIEANLTNNDMSAPQTVTVSNADATANFTCTPNPHDLGEPNNTSATAFPLLADGNPAGGFSVDGVSGDTDDWYSFNVTAGQLVLIQATADLPWAVPPYLIAVQDPGGVFPLGTSVTNTSATFVAFSTGTYVFDVQGPAAYSVTVTAQ